MRRFAMLLALIALASCAHRRPRLQSPVAIPATQLRATEFGLAPSPAAAASPLAARMAAATASATRAPECVRPELAGAPPHAAGSANYLVLSGGSLNGAFGAGFFLGLQDRGALPPEPDIVTGVSTGSLQSTFLFLARQPVPRDRAYGWVGGVATEAGAGIAPLVPGRSNIEDLALAYSIRREADILKPVPLGGIGLLLNGTKGSLDPLRQRLLAIVSPGTIRAVAVEACRGRKLFVGVTDVDDGYGYALDLTQLALLAYDGEASDALMTLVRKAYVEALIASSSVPVGARPVQLRIRDFDRPPAEQHRLNLFVDGGARFGVFLRDIGSAITQAQAEGAAAGDVTLIVNTRLSIEPWHAGDLRDVKTGWLLTMLGLRTVDILENQVYQLSVGIVQARAGKLEMAYISNQNIPGGEEPDAHHYGDDNCAGWHARDEREANPIQFYPRYMACLIDYGRARGRGAQWNVPRN